MTRRGWALFVGLSIIWGMPYLMIRVAVASVDPLIVAFGRTLIGALILLPVAWHKRHLAPAFRRWPALVAFTLVEITGPWLLIGHAETRLNSNSAPMRTISGSANPDATAITIFANNFRSSSPLASAE